MTEIEKLIENRLFALKDEKYQQFHCKLIPTVHPDTVIGVRTPDLRKFAKEFSKTPDVSEFMKRLPHRYYEENNLHGFLIETMKDYDVCINALNDFLPYVDNWATCDLMSPKILKKHLPELYEQIKIWIASHHTYTVRFGIEMLMSFYLGEDFLEEHLALVASVESEEYYIKMMVAWYFATALAKQYERTLPYIEEQKLGIWVHNKTIQKAVESNRILLEQKQYLKTWKVSGAGKV